MSLSYLSRSLRVASSSPILVLIFFWGRFFGDGAGGFASVEAFVIVASSKHRNNYQPQHLLLTPPQSPSLFLRTRPSSSAVGRTLVGCWQEKTPSNDNNNNNNNEEDEEEDTGWGFDVDDELVTQAEQELVVAAMTTASESETTKEERDLFIPVFALVSIAGFAGLYAYEMFRLYFAGELYLPFLH